MRQDASQRIFICKISSRTFHKCITSLRADDGAIMTLQVLNMCLCNPLGWFTCLYFTVKGWASSEPASILFFCSSLSIPFIHFLSSFSFKDYYHRIKYCSFTHGEIMLFFLCFLTACENSVILFCCCLMTQAVLFSKMNLPVNFVFPPKLKMPIF